MIYFDGCSVTMGAELDDKETKRYCESRITRIKDLMRKRGYDPEKLTGQE